MLPLEDQICAIEHAKRFKELGIKQHSLFYFVKDQFTQLPMMECNPDKFIIRSKPFITSNPDNFYSAFTVAELGEMLPATITIPHTWAPYELKMYKHSYGYYIAYYTPNREEGYTLLYALKDKKEANARAKMLIYLLENKLITVEEINKCRG
jgi:hypothetical protein